MLGLTDKEINEILRKIYEGGYTISMLPKKLYYKTAKQLLKALKEGIGKDKLDAVFLNELKTNIWLFSAAKTYTQIKDIQTLVTNDKQLVPYSEYKKLARERFDVYNNSYLKTEYDTTIGQVQNAVKWRDIEATKELFPYLRYNAVLDSHTSEICRPLHGITLPVGDKFWSKFMPLNHFNCRCLIEKIDKYEDVSLTKQSKVDRVSSEVDKDMQPLFKSNVGKTGEVFDKSHPYFDVPKEDKGLAKRNFNLPIE